MLFDYKKNCEQISLSVDGVSLKQVSCTKFLGVWIDDKLNWQSHFEKIIIKLKQNINLLHVSKKFLNVHAKKLIYFSYIQSHIIYGLSVWGSMLTTTKISKLQQIQENCVKLLDSRKSLSELKILRIGDLITLEKLKFCYKYLMDALPKNVSSCIGTDLHGNSLAKSHSYNTRNKRVPNKPKVNCTIYSKSIFCMYSSIYITLPASIKCSKNIMHFVKQCKKWLSDR